MKKIIYISFIFILLISCIEKKEENKTNNIKIKIGYLPEFAGSSTVAVAKGKGFFEEENLDVELFEFFNGHAAIISMMSGEIDFSYIGHATHFFIMNGKVKILFPNGISKAEEIISAKWVNINSIKELKGKTVATHLGTSGEAMLYTALKKAGLQKEDINLINVNITNLANYLINKQADAISTWIPYDKELIDNIPNDYNVLAYITNYSDDIILTTSFISTPEYITNNTEIVKKFSRAMLKAMDYRKKHLDETVNLVAELTGNDIELIKSETNTIICFDTSDIKKACVNKDILKWYKIQQNVFLNANVIKEPVPVTNYMQLDMLQNILNTL